MSEMEDLFGPVISSYTAEQAVEDGFLVAVTKQDLVTRSVWEWLVEKTPMGSKPPSNWPVEMMGWFRAGHVSKEQALKLIAKHGMEAQKKHEEQIRHDKALAMAKGLIGRDSAQAKRKEDAGGIFEIYAEESATEIIGLKEIPREQYCPAYRLMYLRPNECGGCTLLFPEDN